MDTNKKVLIGFAIGWFVLMDAVLRTSNSAFNVLGDFSQLIRVGFLAIGSVIDPYSRSSSGLSYTPAVGLVALFLVVAMLSFYLISLVLKIWYSVIELTRLLVRFMLLDTDDAAEGDEIINQIFGNLSKANKGILFWALFRLFASTWGIILLLQLIASVARSLSY